MGDLPVQTSHIPTGEVELKQDEFQTLKQGSASVCEYHNRVTQLSHYAPREVDSDAKKHKCFLKGLNDDLQLRREMEEKKRKCDLQCQLRNTHPWFAMQPEYQPHPMNLLVSTDQN